MANEKWTVEDGYTYWSVGKSGTEDTFVLQHEEDAKQLAPLLNELEAYRALGTPEELAAMLDERRWRVIGGKETPKPEQWCQIATTVSVREGSAQWQGSRWSDVGADESIQPDGELFYNGCDMGIYYTHWRPAPTDTPTPVAVKEEG